MIKSKIKGFTLAEVLVTLAVIGIVAALTIPSLMKSYQTRQWKTAYRKAFSDMSRAVVMGIGENSFTPRTAKFDAVVTDANFTLLQSFFGKAKECYSSNNSQCWDPNGEEAYMSYPNETDKAFIDKSGRAWSLFDDSENLILVDVNGFTGPNKYGQDRWMFTYADRDSNRIADGGTTQTLPEKVQPFPFQDYTVYSEHWCEYPPCYFKSWLME